MGVSGGCLAHLRLLSSGLLLVEMSGAKELEREDDARIGVEMVIKGIEKGKGSSWDTVRHGGW